MAQNSWAACEAAGDPFDEAMMAFSARAMVSQHLLKSDHFFTCSLCSQAQFQTDGAVVNGVSHDDLYALWSRIAAQTCLSFGEW